MAHFNLQDYQTVQERVEIFRELYPEGRIVNEIVLINEKEVVVKCSVWLNQEQVHPVAVDFAQEFVGSTNVNRTSFLENCSTSATGRAISLLSGEMSPKGRRPSRTEMEKVVRMTEGKPRDYLAEAKTLAEAKNLDGIRITYGDAKRNNAPAELLEQIQALAETLK